MASSEMARLTMVLGVLAALAWASTAGVLRAISRLGILIMVMAGLAAPPVWADDVDEVVIEAARVSPEVLRTSIERKTIFRNRSNRPIDVTFEGYAGQHHISEIMGQVWVIFHRPGRHCYVVRFSAVEGNHLHGVVDVEPAPSRRSPSDPDTERREFPACNGITVTDVCYQP